MKKKLSITFTVLGGAVAIVGMGLLGGTYNSFKNYQSIITLQNYYRNYNYAFDEDSVSVSISSWSNAIANEDSVSISSWNNAIANMKQSEKDNYNNIIQKDKNDFYKVFKTYDDFNSMMKQNSSYSTQHIKDIWGVYMAFFSLDFNYDAEQAGVAAGSVLLVVGVVAFIGFLVVSLKRKKV